MTDPNFNLNENTLQLFRRSPKFIPTPSHACHNSILEGCFDFVRKVKWKSILGNRNTSCRFYSKSSRQPPDALVPVDVSRSCSAFIASVFSMLRKCSICYSKDNLSPECRQELTRLESLNEVIITPADKGGMWTVIPSSSYEREAFRQLADSNFYALIDHDLTLSTRQRLNTLLSLLRDRHFLSSRETRALEPPKEPKHRRFYLLPKIHKNDWPEQDMPPGRPIISDVGSVSRKCASLVEFFLAPLARRAPSFVRDSLHVISRLKGFTVPDEAILFTMDVSSLYTNVPIDEGLAAVSRAFLKYPDPKRPDASILSILSLLLRNNDFFFKDEHFLQTHGTAMGSAYGASFANIFLAEWEEKIFSYNKRPSFWIRYIDDIFGIWNFGLDSLLLFSDFVNAVHPRIKITLTHSYSSVHFLDLKLLKSLNKISFSIAFKSTHSFKLLSPDSFHPPHVFRNILFGQLYRFCVHSSTYDDFRAATATSTTHWKQQGYSRSQIRTSLKKVLSLTIKSPSNWDPGFYSCPCAVCLFSFNPGSVGDGSTNNSYPILHRLCCSNTNVIYLIQCKRCGIRYVGQTSRPLRRRIGEHVANIRSNYATSVSSHFNGSCTLDDFSFTAVEHCPSLNKRLTKENLWMQRLNTIVPYGLNETVNKEKPLHLILPYSDCSQKIIRLCQRTFQHSHIRGAFTMHANLRQRLRTDQ